MNRKVFLDKCTTIFEGSEVNFGLNPIVSLNKGPLNSRFLISFLTHDIREVTKFEDMGDPTKITYTLRMFNCISIDANNIAMPVPSDDVNGIKNRASSFDIVALRCPKNWERGIGFDGENDVFDTGSKAISYDGCNWFQARNDVDWETEGLYTEDEILTEYAKYMDGEDSLVVGTQHFRYGVEDINLDITEYVRGIIADEYPNRGIMVAFIPNTDNKDKITQYVGFFSDQTNTFYEPFVEVKTNEAIKDNRQNFYYGKNNRLYFFCDENVTPTCTINEHEYEVTEQFKGVFYADVNIPRLQYDDETILYDTWNVDGEIVENTFVGMCAPRYTNPQLERREYGRTIVSLSGINNDERVTRANDRIVSVSYRRAYGGINIYPKKEAKYRLYVKDAYREVTVIDWDNIFVSDEDIYFRIFTQDLVPADYHVDVAIDGYVFEDELRFKIVDEVEYLVKNKETFV